MTWWYSFQDRLAINAKKGRSGSIESQNMSKSELAFTHRSENSFYLFLCECLGHPDIQNLVIHNSNPIINYHCLMLCFMRITYYQLIQKTWTCYPFVKKNNSSIQCENTKNSLLLSFSTLVIT